MATTTDTVTLFSFKYVNIQEVRALAIVLPIVSIIVVALRFFTRRLQRMKIGIDDWLILNGLVFLIAMGACMFDGTVHYGGAYGSPTPPPPADIPPEDLIFYIPPSTAYGDKVQYFMRILMMIAYGSIKLSIIAFYRRLFVVYTKDAMDIATKIFAVIISLWTIAFLFLMIFSYGTKVSANWGPPIAESQFCPTVYTMQYGIGISDVLIDILIFVMPLPLIWGLHLSIKKKIAVSGILLLAASAVGASIARMILYILLIRDLKNPDVIIDPNLALTVGMWWSMLEVGLTLIAACLPTLSFLFTRFNLQASLKSIRSIFSLPSIHTFGNSTKSSKAVPGTSDLRLNPYIDMESGKSKKSSANSVVRSDQGDSNGALVDQYDMQEMQK